MRYKDYPLLLSLRENTFTSIQPKQGETAVRLLPQLIDIGGPYDLTDTTVKAIFVKPDRTISFLDCEIEDDVNGIVSIILTNQVLAIPGKVNCEIQISGDKGLAKSWTFSMLVQKSIGTAEIESSNELAVLDEALKHVDEALDAEIERKQAELQRETNEVAREQLKSELLDLQSQLQGGPVARAEFDEHKDKNSSQHILLAVRNPQSLKEHIGGYSKRIETFDNIISMPSNTKGQFRMSQFGNTYTNLIPTFDSGKWNLHANYTINSPFMVTLNATSTGRDGWVTVPVELGKTYTILVRTTNGTARLYKGNAQVHDASRYALSNIAVVGTFTVDVSYNGFVSLRLTNAEVGVFVFERIMMNEGTELKPFIIGTKSTFCSSRLKSVSKNLFDGKFTSGVYLNSVTGNLLVLANARTTGFIKIEPNTQYTMSGGNRTSICYYDINKTFISGQDSPTVPRTITTPSNEGFIRWFYSNDGTHEKPQFEKGTVATIHQPHTSNSMYISAKDTNGQIVVNRSVGSAKDEACFNESTGMYERRQKLEQTTLISAQRITTFSTTLNDNVDLVRMENLQNNLSPLSISFTDAIQTGINIVGWEQRSYTAAANLTTSDIGKYMTRSNGEIFFIIAKNIYSNLANAQASFPNQILIYQLASDLRFPVETFGEAKAYPNGTYYFEHCLWGFINFKVGENSKLIADDKYPVSSIRKVVRYDITEDGKLLETDVTTSASMNGHSIVIANADPSKTYFYDCDIKEGFSTNAQNIIDVEVDNGVVVRNFNAAATPWTLDFNEAKATMLIATNAGGPTSIVAPATEGKMYVIRNTSGQTITVKTASSTGVTVANSKIATVIFYSTDFIKLSEV